MMIKSYSELMKIASYEERYEYLKLKGSVGMDTFGYDRYLNQTFYRSSDWKRLRNYIITRDNGLDMAFPGYEIQGQIYIHHINPLSIEDLKFNSDLLLDPENLIAVSFETHNAIHYGNSNLLVTGPIIRTVNDTCPWK